MENIITALLLVGILIEIVVIVNGLRNYMKFRAKKRKEEAQMRQELAEILEMLRSAKKMLATTKEQL